MRALLIYTFKLKSDQTTRLTNSVKVSLVKKEIDFWSLTVSQSSITFEPVLRSSCKWNARMIRVVTKVRINRKISLLTLELTMASTVLMIMWTLRWWVHSDHLIYRLKSMNSSFSSMRLRCEIILRLNNNLNFTLRFCKKESKNSRRNVRDSRKN